MAKKKTIEIELLKKRINKYLTLNTLSQKEKSSLCYLLESILHDTGNYKGYLYLFKWDDLAFVDAVLQEFNRQYH